MRVAYVNGIISPILIVSVEDEVTGTGSLVHQLVFGIREAEGKVLVMRDWELLKELNALALRRSLKDVPPTIDGESEVTRMKRAFDTDLSAFAPTLHRPVSWPELLLLPGS